MKSLIKRLFTIQPLYQDTIVGMWRLSDGTQIALYYHLYENETGKRKYKAACSLGIGRPFLPTANDMYSHVVKPWMNHEFKAEKKPHLTVVK